VITVFLNCPDAEYLFDTIWNNLNKKSLGFINAWTQFIDLRLERHFVIFCKKETDVNINYLQFSQLKSKGRVHIKHDELEDNLDLTEQQRCIIFNNEDLTKNLALSQKSTCVFCNIRDDEQFIHCVNNLFETSISSIKSFTRSNFDDFPIINLPVKSLVFYDPYFPYVNNSTSKIDIFKIAQSVSDFAGKLIKKISLPNTKFGVNIILVIKEGKDRSGKYYSPIGAIADQNNLKELEDIINTSKTLMNNTVSIVLGNKNFHDRGLYSEYFQIITTNSIHNNSATIVLSGILNDTSGYFSNLSTLNSICNNQIDHLTNQYTMLHRLNLS
jgi:hypothetical protein